MKTLIKCYRNGLTFTIAKQIYDKNHSKYHQYYNQLPESKKENTISWIDKAQKT